MLYLFASLVYREALHARPNVGYKRQPTAQTPRGMATVPTGLIEGVDSGEYTVYCVFFRRSEI